MRFFTFKEHNHSHKRSANEDNLSDSDKLETFLNSISSRNNMNVELIRRFLEFENQQGDISHKINERTSDKELYEQFRNSISYNNRPLKREDDTFRIKREIVANKPDVDKKSELKKPVDDHTSEDNDGDPGNHSAIGVTLVLGFVFMLIIDQIGGKISHGRHLPS